MRFSWMQASKENWSSDEQPHDVVPSVVAASLQRIALAAEKGVRVARRDLRHKNEVAADLRGVAGKEKVRGVPS